MVQRKQKEITRNSWERSLNRVKKGEMMKVTMNQLSRFNPIKLVVEIETRDEFDVMYSTLLNGRTFLKEQKDKETIDLIVNALERTP